VTFDIGPDKINKIWAKEYSPQSKTPEKLVAIATKCYQAQRETRRNTTHVTPSCNQIIEIYKMYGGLQYVSNERQEIIELVYRILTGFWACSTFV